MTGMVRIEGVLAALSDDTMALLPAALARHHRQRGDALTLLVPPGVPPERSARDDGAVTAFLASGPWAEEAAWQDDPPVERCFRALSRALDGSRTPIALKIIDADAPYAAVPAHDLRVEAIVPHRGRNDHLRAALSGLARQTHACRTIVCLDQEPTPDLCRKLAADELYEVTPSPAGPYVPRQHVLMRSTAQYLAFQDSDDVSLPDRVARLVAHAADKGADLVGCHELRCDETIRAVHAVRFPLDVNAALRDAAGAAQLFPTTVARVETVRAAGGLSTDRTFGADKQFHLRNYRRLRMLNLDAFLYVRRLRVGSLTTSATTGMASALRRTVTDRWRQAFADVKDGRIGLDESALAIVHTPVTYELRDLRRGGSVPVELSPDRSPGFTRC